MAPLPSSSLHQLPPWHLIHSRLAMQRLKVLQRLSIGAGSPTPTSFHLLPSETVLLLSSLLSPAYAHAVFICTLPLCKVLLGLLRYCTNPKLLYFTALQSWLHKTQPQTAREINFEMFPLKCTVSKPCTVDRNQCFFNAKAIPPSRGLVGEAPKRQTWEKPRLDVQPLLFPLLLVVPILPRCSCITYVSLSAVHTCISQG